MTVEPEHLNRLVDSEAGWMVEAACRGQETNLFFPENMNVASAAHAVATCHRCPVQLACARYAIVNQIEYGIWGGLAPRARREIIASANKTDRSREQHTYDRYMEHRAAGRNDPVKATARDLNVSTATVYHHIRLVKFAALYLER